MRIERHSDRQEKLWYDEKLSSSATDSYQMVSSLAKRTHSTYNCSIKLSFTEMDAGERNAKRRRSAGC